MPSAWTSYQRSNRHRRRRAEAKHQRLDIQGLRMVAVLTVVANHLWGWPSGGFVGVDVFFVISGFLITGGLLRTAETTGTVSFKRFYWNRARRIVPAATVVLLLTYVASTLAFQPFRARQVGVDALWAFVFGANWHFAAVGTDYFRAASESVSPIQHYWSLSIEEQFYLVWPALIFVISVLVVRRRWTHSHRMQLAGGAMGVIVAGSLVWAMYETVSAPMLAYFNTFARVWELGAGALLAIGAGLFERIPMAMRPLLSWLGLALIGASLLLINDNSGGFPAPWAILPVIGAAFVIAAGVGTEPGWQEFLRNPVSTYIGDISYSLYLMHWPVIILLGAVMEVSPYFYLTTLALSFALAIMSYHLIENPLRRVDLDSLREVQHRIRKRRFWPRKSSQYALVGALSLMLVALIGFTMRPDAFGHAAPPSITAAAATVSSPTGPVLPPQTAALQGEITSALTATAWPALDPPMETVLAGSLQSPEIAACSRDAATEDPNNCRWGSPTAPVRIVLVGDSVALGYAVSLREIAINSNGRIQVLNLAMGSCAFANDLIDRQPLSANCGARKDHAVAAINKTKPNVVIVSNRSSNLQIVGSTEDLTSNDWAKSMRQLIDKFRPNAGKIVFLASPPGDADINDCFSKRSNTPADCIGNVDRKWSSIARAESYLAETIGAVWLDSRPWFCNPDGLCPAFAGTSPTKHDSVHMAPTYGVKIAPALNESLVGAGVFG